MSHPIPDMADIDLTQDDNDQITFLCHHVGVCLAQFSEIEESLAALYGITAQIPKMETAFKTHDEIREFQYRLGATDSVTRTWINNLSDNAARETLEREWNALSGKIKEDSQTRNRIAHFTLAHDENDDGTSTWFVCPYFQMFSHLSALKKQTGKLKIPDKVRKFDLSSMEAKLERFKQTRERIDRFIGGVLANGAQLPE